MTPNLTTTRYDAKGEVIKVWQPGTSPTDVQATLITTNADGDPTSVTAPAGASETASYTADGQLAAVDPAGSAETTLSYDAAGELAGVSVPLQQGGTARAWAAYDDGGRKVASCDASGVITDFAYDLADRCTSISIRGAGRTSTTVYNTLGWVLSSADADGMTTKLTYDKRGQVTERVVSLAGYSDQVSTFEFDSIGRPTHVTNPDASSIETTYNALGQLVSRKLARAGGAVTSDVTLAYDRLGRVTAASDAASGAVSATRTYASSQSGTNEAVLTAGEAAWTISADAPGRELSRLLSWEGSGVATWTVGGRDDAQRATSFTLTTPAAALSFTRAYDTAGRAIGATAPGLSSNTAAYYPTTGQKHQETIGLTGQASVTWDYTYNASGRLISATSGATSLAFDYDAAGQILRSGSTTFAYTAGKLTSSVNASGTTSYTYDRNRRRRTTSPSAVTTYTWDAADRMTGMTIDRNGDGQAETAATHTYDAAGQRQSSAITSGGVTTTTSFTYDGISLLSLASTTGTSTTHLTYLRDELDHPRAVVVDAPELASPVTLALGTTMRGDVVSLTDGAGGTLATWSYDPYGKPTASTVATTALLPDSALVTRIARLQVLRYAGYVYDEPSGLYYLSQRYYDPGTCQFISRDPVGADGEESAYQYCGGDPIGASDPSGCATLEEAMASTVWGVLSWTAKKYGTKYLSKGSQKLLKHYKKKYGAKGPKKATMADVKSPAPNPVEAFRAPPPPSDPIAAFRVTQEHLDLRIEQDTWAEERHRSHVEGAARDPYGYYNVKFTGSTGLALPTVGTVSLVTGCKIMRRSAGEGHGYVGVALGTPFRNPSPLNLTFTQSETGVRHGLGGGWSLTTPGYVLAGAIDWGGIREPTERANVASGGGGSTVYLSGSLSVTFTW